jgi:lysophospholipase L1-like esterase
MTLSIIVLMIASALIVSNLKLRRESRELGRMFHVRRARISLADVLESRGAPEARFRHVRECYSSGQQTDLDVISWNLISQPAPFVGYQPEPGLQTEGPVNRQHMRSARDLVMPGPADVFRIFLIGGSTAYSVGAPSLDQTISGYLEKFLNEKGCPDGRRIEVLNASVCAWSSTHERIWIANAISEWDPDLVLSFTGANDVVWGFDGSNVFNFRTWEDKMYFQGLNKALTMARVRPYSATPPDPLSHPVDPKTVADRFIKNIGISAFVLKASHIPLVVCLQPCLSPSIKPLSAGEQDWMDHGETEGMPDYQQRCFEIMRDRLTALKGPDGTIPNLHFISVDHVFRDRFDPIYLDMLHMGDKGNRLVAKKLAKVLGPIIRKDDAEN